MPKNSSEFGFQLALSGVDRRESGSRVARRYAALACFLFAFAVPSISEAQTNGESQTNSEAQAGQDGQGAKQADDAAPNPVAEQADKEAPAKQSPEPAADVDGAVQQAELGPAGEPELKFAFEGTTWRAVINWLAEESNLALHVGSLPAGSFTYSDPNAFTPQQAIDRVNLFLLPHGYTIVRSGRLLSVINLSDPRGIQQLEALAETVQISDLDQMENHTVVRCFFPLGEFASEDAVEELSVLKLMATPSVLSKTNQLLITDTAGKLKSVKTILAAFQPTTLDNGTMMKNFTLKHVDAEDFLSVARPHLGLATGEMIGIDVSLSADLRGKNIFVTGVADRVKLVEDLVATIDIAEKGLAPNATAELRSHSVQGGNVETVYNVLLTLLSGKSVRLSMDETSGSVIALAPPEIQQEIALTVAQLQAADAEFAVINLKTIDPYFAISLLTEMLELDSVEEASTQFNYDDRSSRYSRDRDRYYSRPQREPVKKSTPPKIDADPVNMRLFVRGQKHQIEQIREIITQLDVPTTSTGGGNLRIFPLRGKQAERAVVTAARFWREDNPVILFPAADAEEQDTERAVSGELPSAGSAGAKNLRTISAPPRLLTEPKQTLAPPIRCQLTLRGLVLQCSDTAALDKFEEHLQAISGPAGTTPSPPIVFYLKHAKAEDAVRMLAELLDGGDAANEVATGSLVNESVSSVGSLFGSFVTSREGMTTMIADTLTVVADNRLNRLVAQGTASDIGRIESYLKIIDKDIGITEVETFGTSHLIELKNSTAEEVAAAIREVYGERVIGGATGQARTPAAPSQQPQRDDRGNSDDDKQRSKNNNSRNVAAGKGKAGYIGPTMTVAVHAPSNSLIVTAPEALWREVEALAKMIDSRNARSIQIMAPDNAPAIHSMLQQVITNAARGASSASPARGVGGSSVARPTPSRSTPSRSTPSRSTPPRPTRTPGR